MSEFKMSSERAAFFLRRFKNDEKMLGPNEKQALDFAISAMTARSPLKHSVVTDAMVDRACAAYRDAYSDGTSLAGEQGMRAAISAALNRSVREILIEAKAMINTPKKWGKGRDSFPMNLSTATERLSPHAALYRVIGSWNVEAEDPFLALGRALPDPWLFTTDFNDDPSTTHSDIMDLFDRAIEASE